MRSSRAACRMVACHLSRDRLDQRENPHQQRAHTKTDASPPLRTSYRHQADTYHAYQIFKAAGLDDDHIVVMHYDDIANGSENPMPGKVRPRNSWNQPGEQDGH